MKPQIDAVTSSDHIIRLHGNPADPALRLNCAGMQFENLRYDISGRWTSSGEHCCTNNISKIRNNNLNKSQLQVMCCCRYWGSGYLYYISPWSRGKHITAASLFSTSSLIRGENLPKGTIAVPRLPLLLLVFTPSSSALIVFFSPPKVRVQRLVC